MGRGGKRPGAGAPRGNLNGFKHGRNSAQYYRLLQIISTNPEALSLLRDLADHNNRRVKRLRKQAEQLLDLLLERAEQLRSDAETRVDERNQTFLPVTWPSPEQTEPETPFNADEFVNAIKDRIYEAQRNQSRDP